ncbi:hypothetical protein G6F43_012839 [Rhizopus delemar]|nr:hypothetical protein G6F43_012839 [Rhizopus delemar]
MEKTKKYRRICKAAKPQEVQNAEDILVNSRSLDLQTFKEYLRNRVMVTELLQRHYTETTTNHLTTHSLHRKLKLSKCIRRQKASENIVTKLKSKFGNDAIFVISNYSAPNIRYQEPGRGIGFRRLLKKHGFLVYLIDEFRTMTMQKISGLKELRERLWNWDLAACLNMSHIACNLRLNDEISERFQHAGEPPVTFQHN